MTFDGKATFDRIKLEAKMKGMTLREIAAYAGLGENTVYAIKNSKNGPSALTIMCLARALRKDPNWIVCWEVHRHDQL